MKINDLISVIVPVHNTEHFLEECLNSILFQTYNNIEIIAVDNGSSDRSGDICDNFSKKHHNIKVIHQENRGASGARNTGIKNASGKYLSFIDSDDIADKEMLEQLYHSIINSDMSCCGYAEINENGDIIERKRNPARDGVFSSDYFLRVIFGMSRMEYQGYVWNKLFRNDIITEYDLKFDESISYNEDRLFVLEYLLRSKKCSYTDKQLYYYRQRSGSVMSKLDSSFDDKALSELHAYEKMERLLKAHPLIRLGMRRQEQVSAKKLLARAEGHTNAENCIREFAKKRRTAIAMPIVYLSKLSELF